MENPLAQSIWLFAFIINLIAYSSSKDKSIKFIGAISLIIWAIHYSLLWLYTGWIIAIIWFIRNIYSIKSVWNKKIMYVFFLLYIFWTIITYKSLFSIYSLIAAFIYLYAFFNLKNLKLRYAMIFWNIFWALYAFYWHSIGLLLSEFIFTFGTFLSIIKIKYPKSLIIKFFNWNLFKLKKVKIKSL